MISRNVVSLGVAGLLAVAALAHGQTPQQQPLVQAGNFAYLGKFTLPVVDSSGKALTWGGRALGIAADGASLYYGCGNTGAVARMRIPTIGGVGTVMESCAGPANLAQINPGDPNDKLLGGALVWNGRLILSAYAYYDGGHTATSSHFAGNTAGAAAGPYRVGTDKPGLVGGYMGVVPTEWRALLGGPALTGQCCISIISRSSYGPSVSVFNPDDLGNSQTVPSKMLVGYPDNHQELGGYDTVTPYFSGASGVGGVAFPAGTRSVLFVGRYATKACYGVGTTDPALDGQPRSGGGKWCYDPSNPYQGMHGYPYKHMVWAYDANDLLAVKQGAKMPWTLRPYATWYLTDMNNNGYANIKSAAFDPATRRLYVVPDSSDSAPTVHVYEITNAVLQPPAGGTEICGDGIDNDNDGLIDEGCNPGGPEICGDLIDNDGDGQIDEGCNQKKVEICGDGVDNDDDGQIDEDCEADTARPGVPQRLWGSVRRSSVSFKWNPPLTGGKVVDYVLEAGLSPGTTFFAGAVGAGTFVTVPEVGTGRYYVRVRARNANGQSAPSNEVVVSVGCRWRPGRLTGLSATSNQGLVSLRWTDPDGCSGTKYNVTVAATTGGMQTLQTEETSATTLLAKGSYVARVVAEAETGSSDPADLPFTVSGSTCVAPAFRTHLRFVVAGRRIGLFWTPLDPETAKADDAVAPVSYVIEAGTLAGATDIGALPMDRATQLITDVPPGTYYARIRPSNACGGGFASNEVKLVVK